MGLFRYISKYMKGAERRPLEASLEGTFPRAPPQVGAFVATKPPDARKKHAFFRQGNRAQGPFCSRKFQFAFDEPLKKGAGQKPGPLPSLPATVAKMRPTRRMTGGKPWFSITRKAPSKRAPFPLYSQNTSQNTSQNSPQGIRKKHTVHTRIARRVAR